MKKQIISLFTAFFVFVAMSFATCATVTVNNQCLFTDGVPTISACGTSPAVLTGGNSNAATITVGTATVNGFGQTVQVTRCTITFATAFTNPPVVTVSTDSPGLQVNLTGPPSATVMTVAFTANAAGHHFAYTAF